MGNALWLTLALPAWFFSAIAQPFQGGTLTEIPALGVLCLAAGLVRGLFQRRLDLLWFAAPVIGSELFDALAGFFRGHVAAPVANPATLAFLVAEGAVALFLVVRLKGARWAASGLGLFATSYALFAAFVASMAFSDSWL